MAEGSVAVAAPAAPAAVTHGAWNLAGDGAEEALDAIKADEAPAENEVSKAASELGRRGGKAAAEAREAVKAKPIKDKAEKDKAEKDKAEKAEPAKAKEAAPEADADEGAEPAAAADEDAEKRSRARQRVEEATRKAAEERRERERVARERDELRAELERERRARQQPAAEERRPAAAPAEADDDPKPRTQDFATHEEYLDARDDWNRRRWQKESEQRQYHERRAQSVVSKVQAFQAKVREQGESFLEEVSPEILNLRPSFMLQGDQPRGENFLADALLLRADHAPAIMRHLSDNPREFQRIAELGPYDIAHEIGRLIGRFESREAGATAGASPATGQPASKPASKAPPPVRPVTGAPSAAAGDYFREGETFDEWMRRTQKR